MINMEKFVKSPIFPWFGSIGTGIVLFGCLIAAVAFRGPEGQRYSIFNYFISELGGIKESELAIAFNMGVFLGGFLLAMFMAGMFFYFTTKIGKVGSVLGVFSGIMGALVGVFPFDVSPRAHGLTATGFFSGGMLTVIFMTIAIFLEKEHLYPLVFKVLGILSGTFFIIFTFALGEFATIFPVPTDSGTFITVSVDAIRPGGLWLIPLFEWLSLLGILLWILAMSIHLQNWRARCTAF